MAELRDWENPAVFEKHKRFGHVPMAAYADEVSAITGNRAASPFVRSLNGEWKFFLALKPESVPDGFMQPQFDTSGWDDIIVPGNWQLQGHKPGAKRDRANTVSTFA